MQDDPRLRAEILDAHLQGEIGRRTEAMQVMFRRVYIDDTGAYAEVRPDRDGRACVEIVYHGEGTDTAFIIPHERAVFVADAIRQCAEELRTETSEEN